VAEVAEAVDARREVDERIAVGTEYPRDDLACETTTVDLY